MRRPKPPKKLFDSIFDDFIPSPELDKFVRESFLDEDSPLFNPDHVHLKQARIGYLWTNCSCRRQMKPVAGMTEIPKPPTQSSDWAKARYRMQLREWFKTDKLDFLITLDAHYAKSCSHICFLALLDHELYHCGQRLDEFGAPKFNNVTGKPIYGILGHDVEEFVGIIRRYGADAGAGETKALIAAAKEKPEIAAAVAAEVCGTCRK